MKMKLCGVIAAGLLMCFGAASANAQDMSKFTLFGGYNYQLSNMGSQASILGIEGGALEECIFTSFCGGGVGLNGYTGSVTYNVNSHFGLEANFSGHNGNPTELAEPATSNANGFSEKLRMDNYIYTFGPAVRVPVGNWSFFGHVLMGGVHNHVGASVACLQSAGDDPCPTTSELAGSSRGNGMALRVGGGVDWNHSRWGVRIAQVDYVHTSTFETLTIDGENLAIQSHTGANNIELAAGVTFNLK